MTAYSALDDGTQIFSPTLQRHRNHTDDTTFPRSEADYASIKVLYLKHVPEAEQLFSLGDFNIWKITPKGGRFAVGSSLAFNLVRPEEGFQDIKLYHSFLQTGPEFIKMPML